MFIQNAHGKKWNYVQKDMKYKLQKLTIHKQIFINKYVFPTPVGPYWLLVACCWLDYKQQRYYLQI